MVNGGFFILSPKVLDLLENDSQNTTFGQKAAKKIKAVFTNGLIAEQSIAFYQKYTKR